MKVSERFRQALETAIESGRISKIQLSRKSKIARPSIDRYLDGDNVPGLDQAEKLAEACGYSLVEFLKSDGQPLPVQQHDLHDCYAEIGKALKLRPTGDEPAQTTLSAAIADVGRAANGKVSAEDDPKTPKR